MSERAPWGRVALLSRGAEGELNGQTVWYMEPASMPNLGITVIEIKGFFKESTTYTASLKYTDELQVGIFGEVPGTWVDFNTVTIRVPLLEFPTSFGDLPDKTLLVELSLDGVSSRRTFSVIVLGARCPLTPAPVLL
eukprot:3703622-Pyramimonas_sp.AAC.2